MILIVVIWKMRDMTGDAAWHIREFKSGLAASNFVKRHKERADVEHVKQIDIL